jgi:hypothetical protein
VLYAVPIGIWQSAERFFETPHDRPPKYASMITVYLDESRQDDPASYMTIAGFWGNKEQWEALIPDWVKALGNRKSLHMKTLRLASKPKRARKLLTRLAMLPYKHGLTPIYGAVKMGDYWDIIENSPHARKLAGYCICLTAVMSRLSRTVPSQEKIKIVCEEQKVYEEIAMQTYRQVRIGISRPERPYFSGIEFIPKDSSVLTQPSDFLAFAVSHFHEDQYSQKSSLCISIFGTRGTIDDFGMTMHRKNIRPIIARTKLFMEGRLNKP